MQEYRADYFHSDQYRGGYQGYDAEAISHEHTFKHRLTDAQRRLGTVGTLLDLGCAFGHLGRVGQQLGWQTFSTDISIYAASRAHQKDGQPVFVSDVTRPCTRHGRFHLICLYDVIEHLPDPVGTLRRLRPLLTPHGVIHISTPDVESRSARLMGRSWYHYKPREHICYFSCQTLRDALTRAGFEVLGIGSLPSYMAVQDVLVRLRFYSRVGADTLLRSCRWLGFHHKVLKISVGEIEAWARVR
ncbi:MAG: class I SAM-dependent methyltransferase [Anaerolineae bacterium]